MKVTFFFVKCSISIPIKFGFCSIYMLLIIRGIESPTGLELKGWYRIAICKKGIIMGDFNTLLLDKEKKGGMP